MNCYVFLAVNLAFSFALSQNPNGPDGQVIVEIGEVKAIEDVNKDSLHDDIVEPPSNIQRNAVSDDDILWTSPVPYVLENNLELNAKGVILRAFDQFRLKSCIDFKPRDSEKYYISVQKLGGCFSYVGRVFSGGQVLSIGRFCDDLSTVEHEFLHALGFYHEQSRFDRDDYVTIVFENIIEGREHNFRKVTEEESITAVPYDYMSVMHYSKNAFSNGNGSTIITKDPKFQDVIGQRRGVSTSDIQELNLRYKCNSTVASSMYCGFSKGDMCQMASCSQRGSGWELVTRVPGGPSYDHTSLPSGSSGPGQDAGYFMHASTASGEEGNSAWLETPRMSTSRECHVQCLQFYYYHSGNESDMLYIWVREFRDESDLRGTRRLMGQITGSRTSHWQLHHVSLNATKHFQVEFEARKGAGSSSGGFSIDDINLYELECPHVTMQINNFERLLSTSEFGHTIYSPRQYSSGGYAYRLAVVLYRIYFGLYVQLLSGDYDDQLEWPCPHRQVTFQLRDQTPNIQLHMSQQRSITSDPNITSSDGSFLWGNPRLIGQMFLDENNEKAFAGPLIGQSFYMTLKDMKSQNFLKGASAIFALNFQDLTPVINGSALPCPEVSPVMTVPPKDLDNGPCTSRKLATSSPPPQTTDESIFGFSPARRASPAVTLLLALILLIP